MCVPALEEEGRAEGWQRKLSWRDLTLLVDGKELYTGKGSERYAAALWATHRTAKWNALLATHITALSMALSVATHQGTALLATKQNALFGDIPGNCTANDTSHCPCSHTPGNCATSDAAHCPYSGTPETVLLATQHTVLIVTHQETALLATHHTALLVTHQETALLATHHTALVMTHQKTALLATHTAFMYGVVNSDTPENCATSYTSHYPCSDTPGNCATRHITLNSELQHTALLCELVDKKICNSTKK